MSNDFIALADFGSTFTKISLVDINTGRLIANGQRPTCVDADVIYGYRKTLEELCSSACIDTAGIKGLAASSAGGGLSVAAVGLVEDYTASAARQAALNAGARVEQVWSGRLNATCLSALHSLAPDVILFSGGTDGGHVQQVVENAAIVADSSYKCPVIVACNSDVAEIVAELFIGKGFDVVVTANVLPEIDNMNIEPARVAINRLFVEKVIMGKGLSNTSEFGNKVIMPTPEAVLVATDLLSKGTSSSPGIGDIIAIDIGGATTDIHSAKKETVLGRGLSMRGLSYPSLMRSVQGDLGMRWNADNVLEEDTLWLEAMFTERNLNSKIMLKACHKRVDDPHFVTSSNSRDTILDWLLAASCATLSIKRHCGSTRAVYVPNQGLDLIQEGSDFRDVPLLVGTGGVLIRMDNGVQVLETALSRQSPTTLSPKSPRIIIDRQYILAAAGLLSTISRQAAFNLMKTELLSD